MADEAPEAPAAVREGSRWLHARPTSQQVIEWFNEQPMHEGMEEKRDRYVGGIVVIGATEKVKVTKLKQNGDPYTVEVEQAVHTPYVKVDTRIAYFRDLVTVLNDGKMQGDFVGVIEPVEVPVINEVTSGYYNGNLKKGLSIHAVRQSADRVTKYLCSTWSVAIYERQSYAEKVKGNLAIPILQGEGTKQTPIMRQYPEDSAVMKAETGAIGRALGVAGILVVGTGVASAEDILEATASGPAPQAGPMTAVLPGEAPQALQGGADATAGEQPPQNDVSAVTEDTTDEELRAMAMRLRGELEKHPDAYKAYVAWWGERGFPPLPELAGPQLKGAVRKLERDLAEVQGA